MLNFFDVIRRSDTLPSKIGVTAQGVAIGLLLTSRGFLLGTSDSEGRMGDSLCGSAHTLRLLLPRTTRLSMMSGLLSSVILQ